jgi:L-alanine-DL-glutamate epimerase-like enolase superfamily enzyme
LEINRIDIIPVSVPRSRTLSLATYGKLGVGTLDFVLTRVHTDEGIYGVGECPPLPPLSPESQPVVVTMIREWLAPQLLGEDPFDLERIWEKMDFAAPTYPMSKAALDIALHDIMGKTLGVPVYRLLGGLYKRKFPLVGLIGIGTEEEITTDAMKYVEDGYRCLRLKIGPKRDVENVRVLKEALGDDVTIRVDCNQCYSTHEAIRVIKAMERYDIELVEQPTVWWDFQALADVARAVDTPIMPHESSFQISDVKSLIDLGAMGVLGLKTYRPGGGLSNARRLLDVGKTMGIPCLFHDDVELGVSLAAATHIIAARGRDIKYKCELSGFPEWISDDVVTPPIKIQDGYAEVPDGPGLGVELDEEKIKKYSAGTITCE